MKREIKFKAICTEPQNTSKYSGKWVFGYFALVRVYDDIIHSFNDIPHIYNSEIDRKSCYWYRIDEDTVCQYVGIKDWTGREVYEEDIVRNGFGETAVVKWDAVRGGYCFIPYDEDSIFRHDALNGAADEGYIEVIGNTYTGIEKREPNLFDI